MTAAYSPIGLENFERGAAARNKFQTMSDYREYKRGTLGYNLCKSDMGQSVRTWTPDELRQMWFLRYEKKPETYTYDQLAKKFKRKDTWDIVNALCEMKRRQRAGVDMYSPYSCGERIIRHEGSKGRKIAEQTKEWIRLRGQGIQPRDIAKMYDRDPKDIRSAVSRIKGKFPDLYERLIAEGKTRADKK